jgi:hypothetical protein
MYVPSTLLLCSAYCMRGLEGLTSPVLEAYTPCMAGAAGVVEVVDATPPSRPVMTDEATKRSLRESGSAYSFRASSRTLKEKVDSPFESSKSRCGGRSSRPVSVKVTCKVSEGADEHSQGNKAREPQETGERINGEHGKLVSNLGHEHGRQHQVSDSEERPYSVEDHEVHPVEGSKERDGRVDCEAIVSKNCDSFHDKILP